MAKHSASTPGRARGSSKLTFLSAVLLATLTAGSLGLSSCGGDKPGSGAEEIYVSFPPLAQFAKRLVAGAVPVVCPVPEGSDPHSWKPSRDEITLFQDAAMVIVHGAELETWVGKAGLSAQRTVDVSAGLKGQYVEIVHPGHSHGAEGEGSHTHTDPHVWMDPVLAKQQAKAIHDAIVAKWPDLKAKAGTAYQQLAADFDELDKRWKAIAPKLKESKNYLAGHAFAYLAKRYGFSFVDELHVSPTKLLSTDALLHLKDHVKDEGSKLLWWESAPSDANKKALSDSFSFRHVLLDTGESAGVTEGADYFELQRKSIDALEAALNG